MVYKLINEWKSDDGNTHEITVYKYNLNHDEMIRYCKSGAHQDIIKRTFITDYTEKPDRMERYCKVIA